MKKVILLLSCIAFIASSLHSEKKFFKLFQLMDGSTPAGIKASVSPVAVVRQPRSTDMDMALMASGDTAPRKAVVVKPGKAKVSATPGKAITRGKAAPLILEINVVPEAMKFDIKLIKVKAGQKVIININNHDSQQHNLVIAKIGSFNKVGEAANVLAADPKGLEKDYVPDIPEILQSTPLLDANASYALEFIAPATRGDYPYMCTFPGHWMMMNGIMRVE